MRQKLIEHILKDSFFYGVLIFLISIILLLLLRIYFNESPRMKNHSAASWKGYVSSWAFIVLMFIFALSLLFRNSI